MKNILPLLALLLLLFYNSNAAIVDTINIHSKLMQKDIKAVVVQPIKKESSTYPVVYLLHGYSGNYSDWIKLAPQITALADLYQIIIVCPDGGFGSWYFDSPATPESKYESYITKEVVPYIDLHYPTIPQTNKRAITGLSMGGHGGLYLGLKHTNLFGAAGSMSGGVDLRNFYKQFEINKRLGDTLQNKWADYSVYHLLDKYPNTKLQMIIDCGTKDFFYTINAALHKKLLHMNIAHDYIERPGEHNWQYWRNAIQYQLLYFHNFFTKQ